jgi:hypothetical protein
MSNKKSNECPSCLRFPCKCGGGGDDVADDNNVTDIFEGQKSSNILVMPQQSLLLNDNLLKQLASFRVMVLSRSSFFAAALPNTNANNTKKQKIVAKLSDDKKGKEKNSAADADNTPTPTPTSITP